MRRRSAVATEPESRRFPKFRNIPNSEETGWVWECIRYYHRRVEPRECDEIQDIFDGVRLVYA